MEDRNLGGVTMHGYSLNYNLYPWGACIKYNVNRDFDLSHGSSGSLTLFAKTMHFVICPKHKNKEGRRNE